MDHPELVCEGLKFMVYCIVVRPGRVQEKPAPCEVVEGERCEEAHRLLDCARVGDKAERGLRE